MPKCSKKFVIVSNRVNNYGYRYDTSGIDISQYRKNPVLLYMHERGRAIGHMQDVTLEDNGNITGYPFFSDTCDFAMKIYNQVEEGTLNMCSSGVEPLMVSDAPEHLLPGQILATVTKGKLKETSIVDIGGDDNALALYHNGEMLLLSDSGTTDITHIIPTITQKNTDMKEQLIPMLLLVGLSKDGTPDQLMSKIQELKTKADVADEHAATIITLNDTIGTLQRAAQDAEVDAVLDAAVSSRKITAEQKPFYKPMGETNIDNLKKLIDTMPVMPTLQSHIGGPGDGSKDAELLKLSYKEAHNSGKLAVIKEKYPAHYKHIYQNHFGKEPQA